MVERMLEGIGVRLQTDYFDDRAYWDSPAKCGGSQLRFFPVANLRQ